LLSFCSQIIYQWSSWQQSYCSFIYFKCRYVSVLILRVCVILIVEKPTVKCSIAIKALFLYSILCLSVMLDYLSWRVPLVEQELLNFLGHLTSPPVFSGVRVTRSLVLCVCFVDRCLSRCPVFFWPLYCVSFFDIRMFIIFLIYIHIVSYCTVLFNYFIFRKCARFRDRPFRFLFFSFFFFFERWLYSLTHPLFSHETIIW
jgi:hypothetical protein